MEVTVSPLEPLLRFPAFPAPSPDNERQERPGFLVWRDREQRNGPHHMAIDEALLKHVDRPVLRLYQWQAPELTLGFFTPLNSVAGDDRPLTRRWTGGGIVEHGDDVTFSLSLPHSFLPRGVTTSHRYRLIHLALAAALGQATSLAPVATPQVGIPVAEASHPGSCFAEPVAWDVLDSASGKKMAGGAQRRSRQGILHQGSLRLPPQFRDPDHPWVESFSTALLLGSCLRSSSWIDPGKAFWEKVEILRRERYESRAWRERF